RRRSGGARHGRRLVHDQSVARERGSMTPVGPTRNPPRRRPDPRPVERPRRSSPPRPRPAPERDRRSVARAPRGYTPPPARTYRPGRPRGRLVVALLVLLVGFGAIAARLVQVQ